MAGSGNTVRQKITKLQHAVFCELHTL